jgi:hypothetical protein
MQMGSYDPKRGMQRGGTPLAKIIFVYTKTYLATHDFENKIYEFLMDHSNRKSPV